MSKARGMAMLGLRPRTLPEHDERELAILRHPNAHGGAPFPRTGGIDRLRTAAHDAVCLNAVVVLSPQTGG